MLASLRCALVQSTSIHVANLGLVLPQLKSTCMEDDLHLLHLTVLASYNLH